jgi:glycosyltransferase involved in cell wall biosynthesis
MPRILYFSRDYTTHDYRFLSALAKTEYEVAFLQLERSGHAFEDRTLPPEIKQIPWVGGQSPTNFRDVPKLIAGLRKVIKDFNPDMIQAGPIQRSAFLVALTGFHPLVTMSWGYDLLHDVRNGRAWEWVTRYTLRRSAAMIGDCDTIRNLAVAYGMDPERIVTFPWGANIEKYSPGKSKPQISVRQRLGWDENTFVLLSTRNWAPLYGVDDLARAFVSVARKRPELRLFMLGNGPLAPTIRRIIQQGSAMEQVQFPGQVSQAKLPDFYRAADLYISTSHSDGTSISLLESLASGTPVLLSDIPGNKEWIRQSGEVGWLFKDGDVDSLANGILRAVENRTKLPTMGRSARQLAEVRGDWTKNFPNLFKAYSIAHSQ